MNDIQKITVSIPDKLYALIRKRIKLQGKTSRLLSRHLFTFFTILIYGEDQLHWTFTQDEARRLATIIDVAHKADAISWAELCTFNGVRLGALVELYAPNETLLASKLSAIGAYEVLALIEYAQTIDDAEIFLKQTAKFRK